MVQREGKVIHFVAETDPAGSDLRTRCSRSAWLGGCPGVVVVHRMFKEFGPGIHRYGKFGISAILCIGGLHLKVILTGIQQFRLGDCITTAFHTDIGY